MKKSLPELKIGKGCNISIQPMSGGLTNTNYKVIVDGVPFFVRVPGEGTELLAVDRHNEYFNTHAAAEAGVGPQSSLLFTEFTGHGSGISRGYDHV